MPQIIEFLPPGTPWWAVYSLALLVVFASCTAIIIKYFAPGSSDGRVEVWRIVFEYLRLRKTQCQCAHPSQDSGEAAAERRRESDTA